MNYLHMLLVAAAVTGCSSPNNTYYTLSTPEIPSAASLTHKTRVMVGPVSVPSLLDSPQIVVKNSNNHVTVYEYQRWAGSLKSNIERVVAADLARDLSTPNVWSYTQSPTAKFDYQVLIDVQNIDSKLGDSVYVDVLWTVKSGLQTLSKDSHTRHHDTSAQPSSAHSVGAARSITGRSSIREQVTGEGFEALVAAQSRAFDAVSHSIASAISQNP